MWVAGRGELTGQLVVVSGPSGMRQDARVIRRALEHPGMNVGALGLGDDAAAPAGRARRSRLSLHEPRRVRKATATGRVPRIGRVQWQLVRDPREARLRRADRGEVGAPGDRGRRGRSRSASIAPTAFFVFIRTPRRFGPSSSGCGAGGPRPSRRSSGGSQGRARSSPRPTGTTFRLINDDLDRTVEEFVAVLNSNGCGG